MAKYLRLKFVVPIIIAVIVLGAISYLYVDESNYLVKNSHLLNLTTEPQVRLYKSIKDNECTQLIFYGHHILEGGSYVFVKYKRYYKSFLDNHDDKIERLSIEINKKTITKGDSYSIGSSPVRMYYSEGGAGMGMWCYGNYATSIDGRITVLSVDNSTVKLLIDAKLFLRSTKDPSFRKEKHLVTKVTFKNITIDKLDSWFKRPGYLTKEDIENAEKGLI